jgi:hypothetical protein
MQAELEAENDANASSSKSKRKRSGSGSGVDGPEEGDEEDADDNVRAPFTLPESLRTILEDDVVGVTFKKKLHKLPKLKTLHQILLEFKEQYTSGGVTTLPVVDPVTNESPIMAVGDPFTCFSRTHEHTRAHTCTHLSFSEGRTFWSSFSFACSWFVSNADCCTAYVFFRLLR